MAKSIAPAPFIITGRHVLLAMVAFFGLIIAVNVVMVRLALKSFPGEQQKKSYLQGLAYNEVLTAKAAQAALGWRIELLSAEISSSDPFRVRIETKDRVLLRELTVDAVLMRPATDVGASMFPLLPTADGLYSGQPSSETATGAWDLRIGVSDAEGTVLTAERRVWVE